MAEANKSKAKHNVEDANLGVCLVCNKDLPPPPPAPPYTHTSWLTPVGGLDCSTCAQRGGVLLLLSRQPSGAPLLMVVAACLIQLGLRALCRKGASLNIRGWPAKAGLCAYRAAGSMTCKDTHTHTRMQ